MTDPIFLTVELVLDFHTRQLKLFGGGDGVRDLALLESAVAQPMASFGDEYLHGDLHLMAAAYLYHLVQNHPFVDGNKRTGVITAVAFLKANGIPTHTAPELYEITISVAEGRMDKDQLAAELRRLFPSPA